MFPNYTPFLEWLRENPDGVAALDDFEVWFYENHTLRGEDIVQRKSGRVLSAGYVTRNGYRTMKIRWPGGAQHNILNHRAKFLLAFGWLPVSVDHDNKSKSDNRLINLRPANRTEQSQNRTKFANKSSRFKGVSWYKPSARWVTHIRVHKKLQHLGYFDSEVEAAKQYDQAAVHYFGDYATLNFELNHIEAI